jgi:Skp family chaperone for outer membrane proteins
MLKLRTCITPVLLLITTLAFAQKNIDVLERNTTMSLGARNGFSVTFEDMSKKELKSRFDEFMKQYGKKITLEEVSKTEYLIDDVTVKTISETPVDIYLLFEEGNKGTVITGFFDMGTQFISSATQPVKYKDAENFMRNFALRIEKIKVQDKLTAVNKVLEKKHDEQKDLEKEKQNLNKDISDCSAAIEKAKNELDKNAKDQDAKKKEIAEEQKSLDDINTELKQYDAY